MLHKFKKYILSFAVITLFLLLSAKTYAQRHVDYVRSLEYGILPGVNWFFSDVGGRPGIGGPFVKDWTFAKKNANISFYAAYNFDSRLALRVTFSAGRMSATDALLPRNNSAGRYYRNLSVRTDVMDAALGVQYTFRKKNFYHDFLPFVAPFVSVEAGLLYYEPKGPLGEGWVKLRPLRTEGQGLSAYPEREVYNEIAFNIPIRLGLQFVLTPDLSLRTELTFRKVFSDYLDDVSTTFIDPSLFEGHLRGADLANALRLYDRSNEINNGINIFKPGEKRGSPENQDTWVTFSMGVIYNISSANRIFKCYSSRLNNKRVKINIR